MKQKNRVSVEEIKSKIDSKEFVISVVGLGYVGLPLAVEFGKAGFHVIGVDVDEKKVESINQGTSYIPDVSMNEVEELVEKGFLKATTDFSIVREVDGIIICVPTPLSKTKDPDMRYIQSAAQNVSQYLKPGHVISLESTTYPGTTDEFLKPIFESTGLKVGENLFLAFSPERIDPGNKKYQVKNTPKVVGGVDPLSTEIIAYLYSKVIDRVVPVSSARAAEMTKLLENTFRSVNIALVNEFAIMCNILGIDVWEVIEAASTKPFGFMPFYPGPGIGGHCIPIDPHYLSWKLKTLNYNARFIELASEINTNMPRYVVQRIADALNEHEKSVKGSSILVLGVAYKKDINDIRESPALDIIRLLEEKGAKVIYNDPYVPELHFNGKKRRSQVLTENLLRATDCVVIATDHSAYDYKWIVENSKLIIDTKNATKNVPQGLKADKVVKL